MTHYNNKHIPAFLRITGTSIMSTKIDSLRKKRGSDSRSLSDLYSVAQEYRPAVNHVLNNCKITTF